MKKLQFYKYTTWGLLGLNLAMLAFFAFSKPHHSLRKGKRGGIVKRLDLNQQQYGEFQDYAKLHHQTVTTISRRQEHLLKPYFYQLADSTLTVDSVAVLDEVQQLERKKITAIHQHFQDVRSILRKEQEPKFELFINDILKNLFKKRKIKRPPPKDF